MSVLEQADRLEACLPLFQEYVRVLRGETKDLTGLGLWRIICDRLEAAMGVKVITVDQWTSFVEMHRTRGLR